MSMLIGHDWALDLLVQQQDSDQTPQSLLIAGPPNIGKSSLARYFMQRLHCEKDNPQEKPCNDCIACRKVLHGNHPDLFIFDEDGSLKIETIRTLQRMLSLSAVESRHRVAILCNFEQATISASNALLKTLEEPANGVVIILTASDPGALLPTITSRCQILTLRPLPSKQVLTALQTHWQVEPTQAELLAQLATGRLGWAVRAIEDAELLTRRHQYLQDLLNLLSANRTERLNYAYKLSQDVTKLKEALIFWITVSRDLMLIQTQCQTPIINLDWHDPLEKLSKQLTISQVRVMVARLRKTLTNLDRNVNPRLNLEVSLLKLPFTR
ncbi:DNA polymerase III subunit delta' [Anaerolineales bacterium HSG6]|nr:DNA polymerase III subunit delta' [Anaerolineales bacterium HSG6]MDM8531967.1 DNA polymerase III subunit delta' [Anaerolineales bacterium HSG25]